MGCAPVRMGFRIRETNPILGQSSSRNLWWRCWPPAALVSWVHEPGFSRDDVHFSYGPDPVWAEETAGDRPPDRQIHGRIQTRRQRIQVAAGNRDAAD